MNAKTIAQWLADSRLLEKGRGLWERNRTDWNLQLSRAEKLQTGAYLILSDYAGGIFPPRFEDQQAAYDAEVAFRETIPGDSADASIAELRKPYWFGGMARVYLSDFLRLCADLQEVGISPPARILELGCGAGWMCDLLARMGFDVTGTSIAPDDITDANRRIDGIQATGLPAKLEFRIAPMETVHRDVADKVPFDAAFVYLALHHAYDWRATFESVYQTLRPGGWFIIAGEPNLLHTFISYRVAKLSGTHEIGLSRTEMLEHLHKVGFSKTRVLRNHFHYFLQAHWIAAQR